MSAFNLMSRETTGPPCRPVKEAPSVGASLQCEARPDGFWVRPPSKFPAPGNGTLRVTVKGKVQSIRHRSSNLAGEAWCYEEMEPSSGSALRAATASFKLNGPKNIRVPNGINIEKRLVRRNYTQIPPPSSHLLGNAI
ncbi:hypothetical protein BU17DRAFT_68143 [Hysterangium stoloniferum]|nr:hypothetical protein BU17DRAFT_68143 [Hysterangium stoloniferum]